MAKSTRITRELTCSYLYADGTLVQCFDEKRNQSKVGETVDVTYGYCKVYLYDRDGIGSFRTKAELGRIVVHERSDDAFVPLAKGGIVTGTVPNLKSGSPNSIEKGIKCQYVHLRLKNNLELSWTDATDILGSRFTVQTGSEFGKISQDLRAGDSWGFNSVVNKVTNLRKEEAA